MSNFEQQLSDEMERRGLNQSEETIAALSPNIKKKAWFSLVAFLKGLFVGALLFAGLIGWAWIGGDKTNKDLLGSLASKTTIVESDIAQPIRMQDVRPTISMPPVDVPADEIPPVTMVLNDPQDVQDSIVDTNEFASDIPMPTTTEMPARNKAGLVPAPVAGLYESGSVGALPVIRGADGLTSFEGYKRPFNKVSEKPSLSVVITDIGLSNKLAENLIENFSPEITFAFSPYANNLKSLMDAAREKGHETWVMLPLETKDYPLTDPGPYSLLMNASVEKNNDRLSRVLSTSQGYVGLIAQKDHVFKVGDAETKPAIQEIFKRGLAVFDGNTNQHSFVKTLAYKNDYPHGKNNFWLDDDLTPLALNQKLRQMKEFGEANGSVTLMLRPYPASLKALQKFLNSAAADNFQLAPASAHVKYGE